jgi:hypothetical protein
MRFPRELEIQVLDAIEEDPSRCYSLDPQYYRADGRVIVHRNNRSQLLHRWLYQQIIGTIPRGTFLLRGCETPTCVNPHHYERNRQPYRARVVERQVGEANGKKKACPSGHRYTKSNTYWWVDGKGNAHRKCRACHLRRTRKRVRTGKE